VIRFPDIPDGMDLPQSKMSLVDYARFSERCLKSNSRITPQNCLVKRADEKLMTSPFSLATSEVER